MNIGIPKEIKNNEFRIGLTPSSVHELVHQGHSVWVEKDAALAIGYTDNDYIQVGATISASANEVFEKTQLIVKVKEPQLVEIEKLNGSHTLFTYLHLASDRPQTDALIQSGCTAIAYETITSNSGVLPLLTPMSEVAGRLAIQAGAYHLQLTQQGQGVLLGGVAGVEAAKVVILGAGIAGTQAMNMALGLGAHVSILDINLERLREIDALHLGQVQTLYSNKHNIQQQLLHADLVIATVLIPGASAPKLITKQHLKQMKKGSVIVDVAIDQGGCCETSKPTTHESPTFVIDDVIHYCVANMPAAAAKTATHALNNATLPYVIQLASGVDDALKNNIHLRNGLNIKHGKLMNEAVAKSQNRPFSPVL